MCGVCGLLSPNGSNQAEAQRTAGAMADALSHRGPDDAGFWFEDGADVCLAHRRLSIVDLSPTGHQPMVSSSGRYVLTLNGEIYNYRDLRRELEQAGQSFRGTSDT